MATTREKKGVFRNAAFSDSIQNEAAGRSTPGHRRAGGGAGGRPAHAGLAGRDGLGQDLHHGQRHRTRAAPDAGARAQQDAGRAALLGVQGALPGQRGGILRFVLRLLPARGLHRDNGHLHRKGFLHQRRDRPPAPQRDGGALRAAGRHHRLLRLLHLFHGRSLGVREHDALPARGDAEGPGRGHRAAGGKPIRPQRHRLLPRHLPRARGRAGGLPRRPAVQGAAPGVLRRRNRPHQRIRPGHRRGLRAPEARADLPGDALRHLPPAARPADRCHRAGPGQAGAVLPRPGQAPGGAAPGAAHKLRHRDAARDRLLLGH